MLEMSFLNFRDYFLRFIQVENVLIKGITLYHIFFPIKHDLGF